MEKERKTFAEQLKKHIDEIGKEKWEREMFEFDCKWYKIDPNAKNAEIKLKRKKWWRNFKYKTCPKILKFVDLFSAMAWSFILGKELCTGNDLLLIGLSTCFSVFFGLKTWKNVKENEV